MVDVLQTVKLLCNERPGIVEDLVSSQSSNYSYADIDTHLSDHNVLSFFPPRISTSLYLLLWYVFYNHLTPMTISRYDLCEATDQLLNYVLLLLFVED